MGPDCFAGEWEDTVLNSTMVSRHQDICKHISLWVPPGEGCEHTRARVGGTRQRQHGNQRVRHGLSHQVHCWLKFQPGVTVFLWKDRRMSYLTLSGVVMSHCGMVGSQ